MTSNNQLQNLYFIRNKTFGISLVVESMKADKNIILFFSVLENT